MICCSNMFRILNIIDFGVGWFLQIYFLCVVHDITFDLKYLPIKSYLLFSYSYLDCYLFILSSFSILLNHHILIEAWVLSECRCHCRTPLFPSSMSKMLSNLFQSNGLSQSEMFQMTQMKLKTFHSFSPSLFYQN